MEEMFTLWSVARSYEQDQSVSSTTAVAQGQFGELRGEGKCLLLEAINRQQQ